VADSRCVLEKARLVAKFKAARAGATQGGRGTVGGLLWGAVRQICRVCYGLDLWPTLSTWTQNSPALRLWTFGAPK